MNFYEMRKENNESYKSLAIGCLTVRDGDLKIVEQFKKMGNEEAARLYQIMADKNQARAEYYLKQIKDLE